MRHRPLRTLLSVLLIAIPVTLILTLVGLSRGMLDESANRTRSVGADIVVRPPNTSLISFSAASLPEEFVGFIEKKPHVTAAVGTVIAPVSGILSVTGVDLPAFEKISGGFEYVEGGPFKQPDDILIDDYYARQQKVHVGDTIQVLNHKWRVAGIFRSGKLARIVLPIKVVQRLQGNTGKISQIYVKLDNPANTETVIEALRRELAGYQIYSMQDIRTLMSVERVDGLNSFINVMIGIAIVIGFAVVCLSMYMSVLQRTREIGILKSLALRAYTSWS